MSCKDVLRREMIETRKALDLKNGDCFVRLIQSLECYKNAKNVMLYMPIKGEADVTGLLQDKKAFFVPVTDKDMLYACRVTGEFVKGSFSVPEPLKKEYFDKDKIDLVLVPGVVFDKEGNRTGYGKGYYDRFLQDIDCVKVGVCHAFQLMDKIESEEHDVKMDMIVTEQDVWIRETT